MLFQFADCTFDSEAFELRRGGAVVDATPQVLSILHYLLVNAGRLVTRAELVEAVWDGRTITDTALTVRIKALRAALGDSGSEQRLIKTVRGKGIRFTAKAETRASAAVRSSAPKEEPSPAPARPPSVAVQPFRLVGEAGPHAMLAEALPDEIITALTKLHSLRVIARGSSFRYLSYAAGPAQVGAELGVGYCLSGQMEIAGDRMILSVELTETGDEAVLWRDRYETALTGVHELREEIVRKVATEADQRISAHELARARLTVPELLNSWQLFHLGSASLLGQVPEPEAAIAYFRQSSEQDTGFARAKAGLSASLASHILWNEPEETGRLWREMETAAQEAWELDPYDPFCNWAMARKFLRTFDFDEFTECVDRWIDLCPSSALAHAGRARAYAVNGEFDRARESLATADRLDPLSLNIEMTEATRIFVNLGEGDVESAARRAESLASYGRFPISITSPVLIALHLADRTAAAQAFADKAKQHFSAPGLRMIFEGLSERSPSTGAIAEAAVQKYALY